MNFKVSNPQTIKRLIQSNPDDIREISFHVKDKDAFLETLLDEITAEGSDWPLAVEPSLIIDTNNLRACEDRAANIVDMMFETDLYGLNILDFGCGDGLTASEMLRRGAKKVVGYDLKPHQFWKERPSLTYTTVAQDAASNGPYDLIFLYDVLDHIMNVDPSVVLEDLKVLKGKEGIIVTRNHPWVARHGGHLYTQLNRAFAHLIFDQQKLTKKGYSCIPTRKIIHPLITYNAWYKKVGLIVVKEDKITEPVEDYFIKNELFKSLFQKAYDHSHMREYKEGRGDFGKVLFYHFVDYILK